MGYDTGRDHDAHGSAGTPWTQTSGGGVSWTSTHDSHGDAPGADLGGDEPPDGGDTDGGDTDGGDTDGGDSDGGDSDGGDSDGGQHRWVVGSAPRGVQARTRVARCATTPGSVLGAAVGALADAVDALAATATADLAGAAAPNDAHGGGSAHAGDSTQGGAGAGGAAAGPDTGLAGEHVDVVGDALVGLAYLRARLDACQLGLLADFERRGGHRATGR
ncbi:MAG: hypothetical protein WD250_05135 [Egibacteraceae bacterium]